MSVTSDTSALYESKNAEMQVYLNDIKEIVLKSEEVLEGNAFYVHTSLDLFPELLTKQINLFWCGMQASTRICEIGFNAGHSTMLMLLGRDTSPIDFTIFDIGDHKYTMPSFDYIVSKFPNVNFEFVEGSSVTEMPKWIFNNSGILGTYDVVHVDGGHTEECISNDMKNADALLRVNGIMIVDDTYEPHINEYVDRYISNGNYIELDVLPTEGYTHRIIRKVY